MMAPWHLRFEIGGIEDGAAFEGLADVAHADHIFARSISTSAQEATQEPFSVAQAIPTPTSF